MMIAASSLIGMTTLLAKILGQGVEGESLHPFQISAGRFFFALLTLLVFSLFYKFRFQSPNYMVHFGRSIFGWAGVTMMFAAVVFIPVSDAVSITFLNPVIAMFLAIYFLKESISKMRWFAAMVSLTGALILLRPGLDSFQWVSFLAFGAVFISFGSTSTFDALVAKKLVV